MSCGFNAAIGEKGKVKLEKSQTRFPVSKLDIYLRSTNTYARELLPIFCFWKMLRRDVAACYRIAAVASMIVGGVSGGNADGATALDSLKVNTA